MTVSSPANMSRRRAGRPERREGSGCRRTVIVTASLPPLRLVARSPLAVSPSLLAVVSSFQLGCAVAVLLVDVGASVRLQIETTYTAWGRSPRRIPRDPER